MKDGTLLSTSSVNHPTIEPTSPSPTDDQILEAWNKMMVTCRDLDDCWFGSHPTLRELNNQSGLKSGQFYIATLLNIVNVATNYSTKLDKLQIKMLSELIYEKFSYLKDTEVTLFFYYLFRDAKKNTFYGALQIETIMDELTNFVRVKRSKAIKHHDIQLEEERIEREKQTDGPWDDYCKRHNIEIASSPIDRVFQGLKVSTSDNSEHIRKVAQFVNDNPDNISSEELEFFRNSLCKRYGEAFNIFLRKEDKE